jgi:hypothetical protein
MDFYLPDSPRKMLTDWEPFVLKIRTVLLIFIQIFETPCYCALTFNDVIPEYFCLSAMFCHKTSVEGSLFLSFL